MKYHCEHPDCTDNDRSLRVLVVCAANTNRSPTVKEFLQKKRPCWEVRSSGVQFASDYPLNKELVDWADRIYTMEIEQHNHIYKKYGKKTIILGIPDQYDAFSQELFDILENMWEYKMFGNYTECEEKKK
jgi:predicted protein tyrosine phosphatase